MRGFLIASVALGMLASCGGSDDSVPSDGGAGPDLEPDSERVLDQPTLELGPDTEGIHSVFCYTLLPDIFALGATDVVYRWSVIEFPEGSQAALAFNEGAPQGPAPGIFCTNCICPEGQNTAAEPCLLTDIQGIWRVELTVTVEQPCEMGKCLTVLTDEFQITVPPALGVRLTWEPGVNMDLHLIGPEEDAELGDPVADCSWDNPYPDWGGNRGTPGSSCGKDPCLCARSGEVNGWCRRPAPGQEYACIDMRNDCNYLYDDFDGTEYGGELILVNAPDPGRYQVVVEYTEAGGSGETHLAQVLVGWYSEIVTPGKQPLLGTLAPGEVWEVGVVVVAKDSSMVVFEPAPVGP